MNPTEIQRLRELCDKSKKWDLYDEGCARHQIPKLLDEVSYFKEWAKAQQKIYEIETDVNKELHDRIVELEEKLESCICEMTGDDYP